MVDLGEGPRPGWLPESDGEVDAVEVLEDPPCRFQVWLAGQILPRA